MGELRIVVDETRRHREMAGHLLGVLLAQRLQFVSCCGCQVLRGDVGRQHRPGLGRATVRTLRRPGRPAVAVALRERLPLPVARGIRLTLPITLGIRLTLPVARGVRLPLTITLGIRLPLPVARSVGLPLSVARRAGRARAALCGPTCRGSTRIFSTRSLCISHGGIPSHRLNERAYQREKATQLWVAFSRKKSGGVLLSHRVPPAVPSAL